ncbi:hypothetical protein LEP1GSC109_3893 [Leptospira interrogans str. UI 13372]|uniref:Uncharacterized protein n=1 Tax=Leptospira interrogans str. UI 12621 TaxID=1049937 RepID=A0A0F6HE55_LEPIR|nr:hypothetical protein LEP1GSC104_4026 [Leptospira interrogans str. UI 12621]EKO94917.1 hypothetical protein LEP1GSC057_0509 [Leptospira interrogans str. Brem 329]EKR17562.1 hypothetical protein LEP1GSC019_1941 [Leptospira interrogans serovar Pyrogenes str. 2006006960]EMN54171.1 hypothetical protein LEP1GSC089_4071 [Leptospira interrogans serovar Autumnalis str. LP101]EMO91688.1 hypothetical protein LEP1GSC109_3893 [Leptospira interrogans str. UI 13372]
MNCRESFVVFFFEEFYAFLSRLSLYEFRFYGFRSALKSYRNVRKSEK